MGPRTLQQKLHSTFDRAVIIGLRPAIDALRIGASNLADFRDHLLREYNKKVYTLRLSAGLFFAPYDGGLRFLGSGATEEGLTDNTGVFLVSKDGFYLQSS